MEESTPSSSKERFNNNPIWCITTSFVWLEVSKIYMEVLSKTLEAESGVIWSVLIVGRDVDQFSFTYRVLDHCYLYSLFFTCLSSMLDSWKDANRRLPYGKTIWANSIVSFNRMSSIIHECTSCMSPPPFLPECCCCTTSISVWRIYSYFILSYTNS
jgi:hypothetical protein